jgi:hypothetical protein
VYVASGSAASAPAYWEDKTGSVPTGCNNLAVGSTVDVDMVNGSVEGASCSFEFTEDMSFVPGEGGYEVQFVNGGNATGQYDVHLSSTTFSALGTPPGGSDAPYYSYILWETSVVVEYDSPTASYTRTVTVPVYNSTR